MVVAECTDENDCKPPASTILPQHLTVTDDQISTETESGIAMATLTASSSSALLKRCSASFGSAEQVDLKRSKLESCSSIEAVPITNVPLQQDHVHSSDIVQTTTGNRLIVGASSHPDNGTITTSSCISPSTENTSRLEQSGEASQVSDSNSSLSATQPQNQEDGQDTTTTTATVKVTDFRNLQEKYSGELDYMLREFQKLERQLLGAKTTVGGAETESVASRERREKLHSFIQHLDDTLQQIATGVELEVARSASGSKKREDEEAVQKLEEHILANLLPVKVRLKKQLAAQQGAKHNPAGMPAVRGGLMLQPDPSQQGKATFLNKVEERRSSLYGNLQGGGSNLTQKLYGAAATSTSQASTSNNNEDSTVAKDTSLISSRKSETKVQYAGLALGSTGTQIVSSVRAANAVHKIEIQDPALIQVRSKLHLALAEESGPDSPTAEDYAELKLSTLAESDLAIPESGDDETALSDDFDDDEPDHIYSKKGTQLSLAAHAAIMSYEEKRKARKKRRKKKKLLLLQQQEHQQLQIAVASSTTGSKRKKLVKKRGPQSVEYMCALCNEVYDSTCDYNPWWALTQHDCPKCGKFQIPRIDIGAPANAIEYHPALLAHADENGGLVVHTPEAVILPPPPPPKETPVTTSDTDIVMESDLSDDDGLLSDDDSFYCSDSDDDNFPIASAADRAENEKFGLEYDGPKLSDVDAARVITLMLHASTCSCQHTNPDQLEVCRSTKYMMLHVRDCPGTTIAYDVCPFPWCRKMKHLLYHLVSCNDPNTCSICSNTNLNRNMRNLQGLNQYRGEKYNELLIIMSRAKAEAEKLKQEAAQQALSENNEELTKSGTDTLKDKLMSEIRSDNAASDLNDRVLSNPDNVCGDKIPRLDSVVDYSIAPPAAVGSTLNNVKSEKYEALSDPILVNVKKEDEISKTAIPSSLNSIEPNNNQTTISTTKVEINSDTLIDTEEAMILPAIGSDQTLVHKNELESNENKLKSDFSDCTLAIINPTTTDDIMTTETVSNIDESVPVVAVSNHTNSNNGEEVPPDENKNNNNAVPESTDTTVVDVETMEKVQ